MGNRSYVSALTGILAFVIVGTFHDLDTKPYTPEDFRFTLKESTLDAICQKIRAISLLGFNANIPWNLQSDGLHVQLPPQASNKYGYALRIKMQ